MKTTRSGKLCLLSAALLAGSQTATAQTPAQPVGQAPVVSQSPPEVAPLFEQPGVLTQPGHMVLEPSYQFGYSSSNRVSLVGYTIIPALLVGLIDIQEIKRNTSTAALTGRWGLNNRLEVEARVPYVYRSDSNVGRATLGSANNEVFSSDGHGVGDVEMGLRYQMNQGGVDQPFYIGALRLKTRTGRDPFEVVTDCTLRCVNPVADGKTGLPLGLPTGSGFYSLLSGLTVIYPSDPAVLFGSLTYTHNFKRDNVYRQVLNGQQEWLGTVEPGDVYGLNFGMGLALNEKMSFSIGYDHSSVGRALVNGAVPAGSVRTQLATLLLGYSYRFNPSTTLNVSVGAGLTRDTPDVSLTVRLPVTF
jgi:hypothetical protein